MWRGNTTATLPPDVEAEGLESRPLKMVQVGSMFLQESSHADTVIRPQRPPQSVDGPSSSVVQRRTNTGPGTLAVTNFI
jgi:hypothetical protein